MLGNEGEARLKREEATTLLKQIIALNLALPSMVALNQNKNGGFDLVLKGHFDVQAMKKFAAEKNLTLKWEKEKDTCTIYKP